MDITAQIKQAAQQYGTPAYIYDGDELLRNYYELRNALPQCVDVFYALKVNPNVSLVHLLVNEGACTEVCSLGELETALKAGSKPENIIFLGPSKKEYEHRRALELGVFALVVESEQELARVSALAQQMGTTAQVAIRINPDFSAKGSPWKMGGRPTHFGIEEQTAIANFGDYLAYPNVHIKGIHVYNGTKILDAQSVYDNCKYILNLYEQISEKYNTSFSMVDVGGGMGIPYFSNETELDIVEFKKLLYPLFQSFNERHPNARVIMESGRYVMGRCGQLVVQVNNMKENHGKTFAVTDGGTNCHLAAIGTGSVIKKNFPLENISAPAEAEMQQYNVSGPLCSPDDLLGRNVELPITSVGDLLRVKMSGAYGPTASPVLFHSHGYPAEVLLKGQEAHLIRERDTVADILSKQILVEQLNGVAV